MVLNKDYFRVPDKEIQHLHSVFTVVAHDEGALG
jgi:hypothetical protein